ALGKRAVPRSAWRRIKRKKFLDLHLRVGVFLHYLRGRGPCVFDDKLKLLKHRSQHFTFASQPISFGGSSYEDEFFAFQPSQILVDSPHRKLGFLRKFSS